MNTTHNTELWKQFGAAIDMFENALDKCPDSLWDGEEKFWYIAYHCLFWTDYYLDTEPQNFGPPAPFTLSEFDEGTLPDTVYSKQQLLEYTRHCYEKCRKLIAGFTPERMEKGWRNDRGSYSMYEMTLYNMRHVQHHTGQLNMLLGRLDHDLPIWVSQTGTELEG